MRWTPLHIRYLNPLVWLLGLSFKRQETPITPGASHAVNVASLDILQENAGFLGRHQILPLAKKPETLPLWESVPSVKEADTGLTNAILGPTPTDKPLLRSWETG